MRNAEYPEKSAQTKVFLFVFLKDSMHLEYISFEILFTT